MLNKVLKKLAAIVKIIKLVTFIVDTISHWPNALDHYRCLTGPGNVFPGSCHRVDSRH